MKKNILGIIPARGGSKGISKKNIRHMAGKSLIAWTILEAKKSKYLNRVILSSDDNEIISEAKKWNCEVPFVRPKEFALDTTPGIDPVLHALHTLDEKFDYVVLLQPTSPLRKVEDIDNCIKKCIDENCVCCVSVTPVNKSPYWMYSLTENEKLRPVLLNSEFITRRQDLPPTYELNGAIYVASVPWLLKTKSFITPDTTAYRMSNINSVDIDSELDIEICEFLLDRLSKHE